MNQEDRIYVYTSKVIGIQHYYGNHGNTTDGNHCSGSHPNEDIKVFKKHRVSDHLYTIFLSMMSSKRIHSASCQPLVQYRYVQDLSISCRPTSKKICGYSICSYYRKLMGFDKISIDSRLSTVKKYILFFGCSRYYASGLHGTNK